MAPDDDTSGGGGGVTITPEIQAVIDAQVAGLKTKNGELIASLRTVKDDLKRFDGIDPVAVQAILSKFASDEEAGLLKAGKIDEVLNKRTERMQGEHAKALKERDERIAKSEAKSARLAAGKLAGAIKDAAIKAGALPEAMEDIVLRGGGLWKLNDDGDLVALNGEEVVLGKDGKSPLSPSEWAESLRETAPHLWPKAQGSNAPGSGHGAGGGRHKGKIDGTPAERTKYLASKYPDLA